MLKFICMRYFTYIHRPFPETQYYHVVRFQGATEEKANMDLTNCFEVGSVAVALSRVRSLKNVGLIGFDRDKVKCDAEALTYWNKQCLQSSLDRLHTLLSVYLRMAILDRADILFDAQVHTPLRS